MLVLSPEIQLLVDGNEIQLTSVYKEVLEK